MKLSKTSFSLIIVVPFVCFFLSPTLSVAKIHHLTILHTNNHKGHFVKFDEYPVHDIGGMAARSTLVNIVRAEVEGAGGHALLLSGGDVNIGTPESDLLYAEPDFKLMKMLGYDAMVLGNLDLHHPLKVLRQQREWGGFPFLSANVVEERTGELIVDPYIIKEFDGLRVAVLGLTLEQGDFSSKHGGILESRNVIETAKALMPKLRTEADMIIALAHIGFSQLRRTSDARELAKKVPEIDVIIGGESDVVFTEPEVIGNTLSIHPGIYGRYVGRLDVTIDSDSGNITEHRYTLLPVNLKTRIKYQGKSYYTYIDKGYIEDPAVLEFIQPYLDQVDELLAQPIGEALVELDHNRELPETTLANLVTDSMRAKTGAEIAFQNAGGIRVNIGPGLITYRDILKTLPYRDTLVMLDMTGAQIMDVLSYAAMRKPNLTGFLHVSGLTWVNKKGVPENVMIGGTPIELDRVYKAVTGSYLAAGGDGYTMLKDLPQYDTGFTDASALREYIMKKGKVAPKVEGRLTIIE